MPTVEEKVDRLEKVLAEFISSVRESRIHTEEELREFKNSVKESQMRTEEELREFKNSVRESQIHTEVEIKAFKDEMKAFKDEMRQINREMNIKWGEMARKLGTITEDLVAPSIPRIVKEEFGLEVEFLGIRMKKRLKDGRVKEYDAIAVAGEYVFVDETKSTLESEDVKDFVKDIQIFREFFPEYKENKIIGILASLYVDENVIRYAENTGFMVLSVGDQLMEVKNTKGFKPKEW
ncbi:MAG: hypothetical protein AB1480_00095 [Nitrospirota bacterium]